MSIFFLIRFMMYFIYHVESVNISYIDTGIFEGIQYKYTFYIILQLIIVLSSFILFKLLLFLKGIQEVYIYIQCSCTVY
jgi:hypothetical protein